MLNQVKEYIKEKLPGMSGTDSDDEEAAEERRHRKERKRREKEEERRRMSPYERREMERREKKKKRMELVKQIAGQDINNQGGYSFKVCDMERLRRFIILGSEFNTYYCTPKEILIESVQCVSRLIASNHYKEVLDMIEQYGREGRAAKDEPLLTVLSICALNERTEVKQAAYEKVNSICNIPTKLFKFVDLTHNEIVRRRIASPPDPQPFTSRKRKHKAAEVGISELTIGEEERSEPSENAEVGVSEPMISEEEKREPSENVDETLAPPKKKKKKKKKEKEFKKVNIAATKSLGWGRMRRNGVAKFYTDDRKDACRLLYMMTKYKQRHNWDHKTVMQYTHPKMSGDELIGKNLVLRYCLNGFEKVANELKEVAAKPDVSEKTREVITYIETIDAVKNLKPDTPGDEDKLIEYLEKYGDSGPKGKAQGGRRPHIQIVREHIPTGFLNSQKVWELMLAGMPMHAMIRNLGKMSSLQMFENNPKNTKLILAALDNEKRLQGARVHPVKLLIAAQTYQRGSGEKGSLTWPVNKEIIKSLNAAFYKSFKSPELGKTFKTGKKYLLGLDVSGSMQGGGCHGCESLTPAMATAAMAMVTWNIEDDKHVEIMGFGGTFLDLKPLLKQSMLVQEAMNEIRKLNFGNTDCSLPMIFALTEKKEVDVFIVYTDSETGYDTWQPMEALNIYNSVMKREAKLVVCAMTSNGFSIADPNNPNALDICGFDANVPEIINNFVTGNKDVKCRVCDDCKKAQEPSSASPQEPSSASPQEPSSASPQEPSSASSAE